MKNTILTLVVSLTLLIACMSSAFARDVTIEQKVKEPSSTKVYSYYYLTITDENETPLTGALLSKDGGKTYTWEESVNPVRLTVPSGTIKNNVMNGLVLFGFYPNGDHSIKLDLPDNIQIKAGYSTKSSNLTVVVPAKGYTAQSVESTDATGSITYFYTLTK